MIPDRASASVAWLLAGAVVTACSSPTGPAVDRDAEKRKSFTREEAPKPQWQEAEIMLPSFPREEDLVEVEMSGPRTFTFLVDAKSVSVDDDGVVRYSLIARSEAAQNVSYEGMRCETNQYKAYAFGSQDRTWSRVSGDNWITISKQQANNFRDALARYYFCPYGVPQSSSGKAVAALKHGIPHPPGR